MKFSIKKTGQTGLLVALCVLASACNPDEFFPIEEFLTGDDAVCYEAKDLDSCRALADKCQPAFVESDDEAKPLDFLVCIANPKVDDGSTTGGSSVGGTDGGADGSATAGSTDGSATAGSTDGSATAGSTDGSATAGSTDGSATAGGTDGSTAGGSTTGGTTGSSTNGGNNGNGNGGGNNGSNSGGVITDPDAIPTIEDAYNSKCQNLSSEYLWEKTETKKGKVISKTSKVKVCHMTGNGSSHTIVIACPALKAHIPHQQDGDYLGACF